MGRFVLPSPTDKISAKIERFWETTLVRCPNRAVRLLKLDESGTLLTIPSREVVLDRKTQILDVSKNSRDVVRNCRRTKRWSQLLSIVLAVGKVCARTTTTTLPAPVRNVLMRVPLFFQNSFVFGAVLACLFLVSVLADKLEHEYYFKYTDDHRRTDMKK